MPDKKTQPIRVSRSHRILLLCFLVIGSVLAACSYGTNQPETSIEAINRTPTLLTSSAIPMESLPTLTQTASSPVISETPLVENRTRNASTPHPTSSPIPETEFSDWTELPVIPAIHPIMREVYQRGLEMGKTGRAFSKVGDCGSDAVWFLTDFDRGPNFYRLGEYEHLQTVIEAYQGSYERTSLAAKQGFTTASLFAPIWSDRALCEPDEGPLACEYRLHQPSIAFILVGSNDVYHAQRFETGLKLIVENSLEQGVIPVLSTKADNLEGDGSINTIIAQVASEYQVPLINFWLAVQSLPAQGLQADAVHLTFAGNRFDDHIAMQKAWPIRNLTALQMLDAIHQFINN